MNAEEIKVKIAEIVAEQDELDRKMEMIAPCHSEEFTEMMNARRELTKKIIPLQDALIDMIPLHEIVDTRTDEQIFEDMTNN